MPEREIEILQQMEMGFLLEMMLMLLSLKKLR